MKEKRGRGKYKKKIRVPKRPMEMITLHRLAANAYQHQWVDG
ncbi:hypothetical protein ACWCXX_28150 [Streptomyces sp. NPDC001732]